MHVKAVAIAALVFGPCVRVDFTFGPVTEIITPVGPRRHFSCETEPDLYHRYTIE